MCESPRYSRSWSPSRHTAASGSSGTPSERTPAYNGRPSGRNGSVASLQQLDGAVDAFWSVAEDPSQLGDRAVGARLADRRRVRALPPELDERHDDGRVEDGEGGGDDVAGDLPHHAAAAREVGRSIGERDASGESRARIETERDVVGVALGREVHLPDHWLEHGAEAPCDLREVRTRRHGTRR